MQYAEQGSFSFYDEPCAIRIRGDLEALIREFPSKELQPVADEPVYLKTDELLVTEEALTLWKKFRDLLGDMKLIYLPSQLSELVRYNSEFDSLDTHLDYGDEKATALGAAILKSQPFFEATLFGLSDDAPENESYGSFEQSLITHRRRSPLPKGIEILGGMPIPAMAGAHSNGR